MTNNWRLRALFTSVISAALMAACGGDEDKGGSSSGDGDSGDGDGDGDAGDGDGDGDIGDGDGSGGQGDGDGTGGQGDGDGSFSDLPSGLDARPPNSTCVAPDRPAFSGPVQWTYADTALGGLMMMRQLPDGSWIEITRTGGIHGRAPNGDRSLLHTVPNVPTDGEMGLLGLDVHPNYPTSPYIFVYYTTFDNDGDVHVRIDRYTVTGAGGTMAIDGGSREEVLDFDRGASSPNHLGGAIEFDPLSDPPMLYAALGDGENQAAVQDEGALNGKLVRFDVDGGAPYTAEIVAVGLRNPFRWSFDSQTGDLWIGDVGEGQIEEVTQLLAADIPSGADAPLNLGWPIMEGTVCRNGGDPGDYCGEATPARLPLIPPTNEYGHEDGVSVIGGRVYRGTEVPGAFGAYFFNDIFPQGGEPSWRLIANPSELPGNPSDDYTREVLNEGGFVAYTEDLQGELYALNFGFGGVYKLEEVPGGMTPPEPVAATLSATGCFDSAGEAESSLIPYDLNAALWSDGATKRRWLSLPDGESIGVDEDGDFDFPPGTVLAKEFTLDGVRVETRLFMRHPDGVWAGYSYTWIDDTGNTLADAELLPDQAVTRTPSGAGAAWTYPSRSQCNQCHTAAAGGSLGIEVGQLNRDFDYPGAATGNQVATLVAIGMLDSEVDAFYGRAFPRYDDDAATAEQRAWSYLHSNCSGCHQPGAPGNMGRSAMPDLRYDLFQEDSLSARLCGVEPGAGDLGLGAGALLVSPGTPGDWADLGSGGSVLYLRMAARSSVAGSTGTMPLIGSEVLDETNGLPLVAGWIQELMCP